MTMAPPITTETILQEDGAEATLAVFATEVHAGEDAIRTILAESPQQTWTMRELEDLAAEGRRTTAMGVALMGLLKAGELRIDHATSIVEALD